MNLFLFDINLFFLSVELFLSVTLLIFLIFGSVCVSSFFLNRPIIYRSILDLSVISLILALHLNLKNVWFFNVFSTSFFIFDFVGLVFKSVVLLSSIFFFLISSNFLERQKIIFFEYFLLIVTSIIGMLLLISCFNVISLFLALELQSFCFYILACYKKDSIYSTEAGLKYFLLGGLSTAIVLLGVSLLYGFLGTTNFRDVLVLNLSDYYDNYIVGFAILLIFFGFLFKLGSFPFHAWLPDVYEGSPVSTVIFFAVSAKIAMFGIFSRFIQINSNNIFFDWHPLLLFCGLSSIFFGSFLAIKQKKVKRLLAYSSVSHVGYILLALSTGSLDSFYGFFFYLFVYSLATLSVWGMLLHVQNSLSLLRAINLTDFCSVFIFNKSLALSILIAIFSIAGIPPFIGFYGKFCLFFSLIDSNYFVVVIVTFLMTTVSTFFYLRLVKTVFFENFLNLNLFSALTYYNSNLLALSSFFLTFFFFNPLLLDILMYRLAINF